MVSKTVLLNEDAAQEYALSIEDAVLRNLVLMGISHARMRVGRKVGQQAEYWQAQLPSEAFDMKFFAEVLASLFRRPDIIKAVLDGKNPAEASGWDL
jgi:hypothetical protein